MDEELRKKLNERIESFIREVKPNGDRLFSSKELMPIYEEKLNEYSNEVYGKIDIDFINEMLTELKNSLTPNVIETTDGTDEILTSILDIELATIIFRYDEKNRNDLSDKDRGRDSIRRAILYFFDGPHKKFFNALKKHIYRSQSANNLSQNSGCVVLLISTIGLIIFSLSI